uniref:Uncharacterized protein n=1 Tax=Cacopsylla melanoneura TaxID=428564 RepID=A0A8D8X8Z1_9HEMI
MRNSCMFQRGTHRIEKINRMLPLVFEIVVELLDDTSFPVVVTICSFQRNGKAANCIQIDYQLSCLHKQVCGSNEVDTVCLPVEERESLLFLEIKHCNLDRT